MSASSRSVQGRSCGLDGSAAKNSSVVPPMSFPRSPSLYPRMAASAPQTVVFALGGKIARTDLPGLCEHVCALLDTSGANIALCDVSEVEPDAASVDALGRLYVAARRRGCQARLRGASNELLELL